MVQAIGPLGGLTRQSPDLSAVTASTVSTASAVLTGLAGLTASSEVAVQPEIINNMIRLIAGFTSSLCKVSTPGHTYPDGSDHDQAKQRRSGTHILGPAR